MFLDVVTQLQCCITDTMAWNTNYDITTPRNQWNGCVNQKNWL